MSDYDPTNIIDAYGDYAGLEGMAAYLENHPAETIHTGVRRWIINDMIGNSSEGSTQVQEARKLLKIESTSRFNLSLAKRPSVWSLIAGLLKRWGVL